MKNFKPILYSFFILTLIFGCSKDDALESIQTEETLITSPNSNSGEVGFRSYDEEDCGSIRELCMKCIIVAEPDDPVLALSNLGGNSGKEGIDDNFLKVVVGNDEYTIRPAKFFGGESKEYVISTPTGNYITSNIDNDYVKSKALDMSLPKVFEGIYGLDYGAFVEGELSIEKIKEVFGQGSETISNESGDYTIGIQDNGQVSDPSALLIFNPCEGVTMAALVLRYQEILGMNEPHSNAEQIIENALNLCKPIGFDPKKDCINTQCVMSEILNNPEIAGSPYAQFLIKLNYLSTLLGLDESTYEELKFYTNENIALVNEVSSVRLRNQKSS